MEEREWVRTIQIEGNPEEPNSETWLITMDYPNRLNNHQTIIEVTRIILNNEGERSIQVFPMPLSVWDNISDFVQKERSF